MTNSTLALSLASLLLSSPLYAVGQLVPVSDDNFTSPVTFVIDKITEIKMPTCYFNYPRLEFENNIGWNAVNAMQGRVIRYKVTDRESWIILGFSIDKRRKTSTPISVQGVSVQVLCSDLPDSHQKDLAMPVGYNSRNNVTINRFQ